MEKVVVDVVKSEKYGDIRYVNINGDVWFVGNDVARAFGITSTSYAIRKVCVNISKMKIIRKVSDLGGVGTNFIGYDDVLRLCEESESYGARNRDDVLAHITKILDVAELDDGEGVSIEFEREKRGELEIIDDKDEIRLINKDNSIYASSKTVAEDFKKRHDHVLRDIRDVQKDIPNSGEMYLETTEQDSYGRNQKIYYMTKDAFILLVMGYKGEKAMETKIKYINQFNLMEESLRTLIPTLDEEQKLQLAIVTAKTMDEKIKASADLDLFRKRQIAERDELIQEQNEKLELTEPKANYYDAVMDSNGTINANTIAKRYGKSAKTLNILLKELGVQYKNGDSWCLYYKYQDKSYVKLVTGINGGFSYTQMRWTQKGAEFIHELIQDYLDDRDMLDMVKVNELVRVNEEKRLFS